MKNQWLWNVLSIVLLAVGLVVWILLPWQGVLAVAVLLGLWLALPAPVDWRLPPRASVSPACRNAGVLPA